MTKKLKREKGHEFVAGYGASMRARMSRISARSSLATVGVAARAAAVGVVSDAAFKDKLSLAEDRVPECDGVDNTYQSLLRCRSPFPNRLPFRSSSL